MEVVLERQKRARDQCGVEGKILTFIYVPFCPCFGETLDNIYKRGCVMSK